VKELNKIRAKLQVRGADHLVYWNKQLSSISYGTSMKRVVRVVLLLLGFAAIPTQTFGKIDTVRAMYLSAEQIGNEKTVSKIEEILTETDANAVVIDFKIGRTLSERRIRALIERFKKHDAYLIARIVVMQDSYLARTNPSVALHRPDGTLWYSGDAVWKRYWVDPAHPEVLRINIEISKRAIDLGFDELNFDYIRFPTDGAMQSIVYPTFRPQTMKKVEVMSTFFKELTGALRAYRPSILLSIDIFGEVAAYNSGREIGQELGSCATYFDILCPMVYPSHYRCNTFGFTDPTAHPYDVCRKTLEGANAFLSGRSLRVTVRPWFQAFSIPSVYRCGPPIFYGPQEIRNEIRGSEDAKTPSFMLWNAGSKYSPAYFGTK